MPSKHLCDSQVCCVNFLYPFAHKPNTLKKLLQPLFPSIKKILKIEVNQYIAFELIGERNYLGEKTPKDWKRTRGANFSSADAALIFETNVGSRQIVLIEWKYTESYGKTPIITSQSDSDSINTYKRLYERKVSPFNNDPNIRIKCVCRSSGLIELW